MKLTLTKRIIIGLIILTFMVLVSNFVYAEVPDVSKWSCPNAVVDNFPNYGVEVVSCESYDSGGYIKVSGEIVYIHQHKTNADKTVYYNALKINTGVWAEVTNSDDVLYDFERKENVDVILMILDDNKKVVAKRLVPLLIKE